MQEARGADTDLYQVRVNHITGEHDVDWPISCVTFPGHLTSLDIHVSATK